LVQIHVKLLLIEPRGLLNVPEDRAVNVAACACSMSGQESKRDQKGTSESAKSGKSGTFDAVWTSDQFWISPP
jgi:hypothetical protein